MAARTTTGFLTTTTSGSGISIFQKATSLGAGDDTDKINELNKNLGMFQNLHDKVIDVLKQSLIYYKGGQFGELNELFTTEQYNKLSSNLINSTLLKNVSEDYQYNARLFTYYRESFHRVLEGLQKSIYQNEELTTTQSQLVTAQEKADILDDMAKLREYLENKQSQIFFADVSTQLTTMAVLKPQYQRYIDLYGMPDGLIFESQKMAEIIQDLLIEGVITEEDVFGSS
tara:strand:+ start:1435 stop:2121 length:687 start_codon:yes stop_codon:yes gene_type:complete